jgi:hypothetical protein
VRLPRWLLAAALVAALLDVPAVAAVAAPTSTTTSIPGGGSPGGVQTTLPAPQPTQPSAAAPPGNGGFRDRLRDRLPPPFGNGPSVIDIGARVRDAVNGWFRDLVASALTPTLGLLGRSVFATPDVTAPGGRARQLWWVCAGLANSLFVLLVLAGGVLVIGHETVQTSYSAKEIAPRLVLGFVAANSSLLLAGQGIALANALSRALLGQGVDPDHVSDQINQLALAPLDGGGIFLVLLVGVVAVLALIIVATYVVRVALVIILVAGAPLALACHALPATEGLALGWWRAMAACLGVQVGQALTLVTALRVFFASDRASVLGLGPASQLIDLIVVACLLWILARLPVWAGRAVFTGRRSTLVRLARSYVIYRGIRAVGIGR